MKKLSWLPILFSIGIILLAASQLKWAALLQAIEQVQPIYLFAALGMWAGLVLLKVLKWKLVVRAMNGRVGNIESFVALMVGLFVGVMTPGRIGDFVRAAYVKEKLSWGKGIMCVVMDRAMDILILMALGLLGLAGLSKAANIGFLSTTNAAFLLVLAVVALYLALKKSFMKRVAYPILKRFVPERFMRLLTSVGKEFYESVPLLKKNILYIAAAALVTLASWFFSITFGYILMQGIHLPVDWSVALLTVPVLALIEILPVSVVGIGTRELAAIIVLGVFHIPPEQAVLFSLLYFLLGYIPSFILGLILFNTRPFPIEGGLEGVKRQFSGQSLPGAK